MGNQIYLPLYSEKGGLNVPERSGLNQWNADERPRNYDEVYIPIPAFIHEWFAGFFPDRNTYFTLITDNGKTMTAKVCQENSKALMSTPNSELGEWILRDILKVEQGQLVTYDMLYDKKIDSVCVTKIYNKETQRTYYGIKPADFGSYRRQKEALRYR